MIKRLLLVPAVLIAAILGVIIAGLYVFPRWVIANDLDIWPAFYLIDKVDKYLT